MIIRTISNVQDYPMLSTNDTLQWIDTREQQLLSTLIQWANINSGTYNLPGINTMADQLTTHLNTLPGQLQTIPLPPHQVIDADASTIEYPLGPALRLTKPHTPTQKIKIFFAIHYDTVYPVDSPFQTTTQNGNKLHGPAVADAKGGLLVLLTTIQAIEHSPLAPLVHWEIFLNSDEEISSPATSHLWTIFQK